MESVNQRELDSKVKSIYKDVAENPGGDFHFEMGRALAERLGYATELLDRLPKEAIDSFAGVGNPFELANPRAGDSVLDLGSGAGTDSFVAALLASSVVGIDITQEQLDKARTLTRESNFKNVTFERAYMEELPFVDGTFDMVISNGVINLSAAKDRVFTEVARVLKPGGRMAIADIVSNQQLDEAIKQDPDLWAACIGGAMQIDTYQQIVQSAGLRVDRVKDNSQYAFLSSSAQGAADKFGVKSVTLLAHKD